MTPAQFCYTLSPAGVYGGNFICTLEADHKGDHVARGPRSDDYPRGELLHTWERS